MTVSKNQFSKNMILSQLKSIKKLLIL